MHKVWLPPHTSHTSLPLTGTKLSNCCTWTYGHLEHRGFRCALSCPAALQRRSSLQSPRDSSASVRFSGRAQHGDPNKWLGSVFFRFLFIFFPSFRFVQSFPALKVRIHGGVIESQVVLLLKWRTPPSHTKTIVSLGSLVDKLVSFKPFRLHSVRGWMENFRFATHFGL